MKVLPKEANFLALEKENSTFDSSEIVIIPAPYEHRVSYSGGTSEGPSKILEASAYVEFFDDEFKRELCFEKGIATLEALDFVNHKDLEALSLIENQVQKMLDYGKFVVTIGGEHTISAAPIASHYRKYPNMSILQFDAHSDFREEYDGSEFSHASVMSRVSKFYPPGRITQVGIRALCKEEADFIEHNKVNTFFASSIRRGKYGTNWQNEVVGKLSDEVYITFDVDYFDPSIMPATGTPEPDGFYYSETLDLLRILIQEGKTIVGFDVVEFAPIDKLHHSELTCARLIYKILNFAFSKQ